MLDGSRRAESLFWENTTSEHRTNLVRIIHWRGENDRLNGSTPTNIKPSATHYLESVDSRSLVDGYGRATNLHIVTAPSAAELGSRSQLSTTLS